MTTPYLSADELVALWRSDRLKALEVAAEIGAANDRLMLAHRAEERDDGKDRQSAGVRA